MVGTLTTMMIMMMMVQIVAMIIMTTTRAMLMTVIRMVTVQQHKQFQQWALQLSWLKQVEQRCHSDDDDNLDRGDDDDDDYADIAMMKMMMTRRRSAWRCFSSAVLRGTRRWRCACIGYGLACTRDRHISTDRAWWGWGSGGKENTLQEL